MLTLTRVKGETVVITMPDGRRVTVTVLAGNKQSGTLRLGFVAPSDIPINRGEVQAEIDAKTEHATKREG